MKNLNILRITLLSFIFCCLSFFVIKAQDQGKVWATILNPSDVPFINAQGNLVSNDVSFSSMISELGITNVTKAVPASKRGSLMKVYEISSSSTNSVDLLALLSNNVSVLSRIEYAPTYETLATPNDHRATNEDYAINLINSEVAWDYSTGDSSVVIAISDQNIDTNHIELAGKVVYYNANNSTSTTHGTAVSIVAAGRTNNNAFSSHIGYNCSIAFYQMSYNDVLAASYAGLKVINLSWTSGCEFNQYLQGVMDEVYNNGTFIVAAAGNGSTCGGAENLVYPAAYDHVFSVTSIGEFDNHERILGDPLTTHQHNETVDLSAPGYDVLISPAQNWEMEGSGTSYAAPFVTGTVGLMLAANPCLTNENIEYILKSSSAFIDDINPDYAGLIGTGRLDAGAALAMTMDFNEMQLSGFASFSCGEIGMQLEMSVDGGNAPYTIEWSNGQTDLSLSNLVAGEYTLTVTDVLGCVIDTTITIEDVSLPVIEGEIQHVSCNGIANGAIDISILEGVPNYTFEWDNGMTTEDVYGLSAGTYRLNITDGNGCEYWSSYDVLEPLDIQASVAVVGPLLYAPFNDVDLTVQGGTAPYTYTWNTGDVSEDLYGVPAGYYQVTVMDIEGCSKEINTTIENLNVSGVSDLDSRHVDVYPNPTTDYATVSWDNKAINTLTIISANGQMVQKADVTSKSTHTVQDLNSGIYFINLSDNNNFSTTQKLIVR